MTEPRDPHDPTTFDPNLRRRVNAAGDKITRGRCWTCKHLYQWATHRDFPFSRALCVKGHKLNRVLGDLYGDTMARMGRPRFNPETEQERDQRLAKAKATRAARKAALAGPHQTTLVEPQAIEAAATRIADLANQDVPEHTVQAIEAQIRANMRAAAADPVPLPVAVQYSTNTDPMVRALWAVQFQLQRLADAWCGGKGK